MFCSGSELKAADTSPVFTKFVWSEHEGAKHEEAHISSRPEKQCLTENKKKGGGRVKRLMPKTLFALAALLTDDSSDHSHQGHTFLL